jgi:hypothetical protein
MMKKKSRVAEAKFGLEEVNGSDARPEPAATGPDENIREDLQYRGNIRLS